MGDTFNEVVGLDTLGVTIFPDGTYQEYQGQNYPPEVGSYGDAEEFIDLLNQGNLKGWVPVRGLSSQGGVSSSGFLMHRSEYLTEGVVGSLLETYGPGQYAAVAILDEDEGLDDMWVLLYFSGTV